MTLFNLPDVDLPRKLSATERLTRRNHADLARGVHPVARIPLRTEGGQCGTCEHLVAARHARTYYKCGLTTMSRSATSDVRLWWPACVKYTERSTDG